MTTYSIDLNARNVPAERNIWRVFPGDKYRFLDDFLGFSVVFLDLAGLDLPDGPVDRNTPFLRERIIASHYIQVWMTAKMDWDRSERSQPEPVRPDVTQFGDYTALPSHNSFKNNLGSIINLFGRVKKGDLVITPDRPNKRRIWIGEIRDDGLSRRWASGPRWLDDIKTPARQISWFPSVAEITLPEELVATLRTPNPVSIISRNFYNHVFEKSYGTFFRGGEYFARLMVGGDDFTGQDTFDFGALAKMAARSVELSQMNLAPESFGNYLDAIQKSELLPTLSLNINSPGSGFFRASALTPLVFAALYSLCSVAAATEVPPSADVAVTNSSSSEDDPCLVDVEKAVRQTLDLMGLSQWKAACMRARSLAQGRQLYT